MKPWHLNRILVTACFVLVTAAQPFAQPRRRSSRVVTGQTDIVWSVTFSPDGRTLAIARGIGNAGRVELWDAESGILVHSIKGFDGVVWSVSFAPDGKTLVTGSGGIHTNKIQEKLARRNGTPFVELKWWNPETGELKQRVELPGEDRVSLAAFHSPDGRQLATVEYRAMVAVKGFGMSDPGVMPGGRSMMPMMRSAVYDADLRLLDARTGELRLKLKGGIGGYEMPFFGGYSMSDLFGIYLTNQRRQPVAFSPNGQLVAAWNAKEIKFWNTATGEEVRRLKDFKGRLSAAVFTADGGSLVAAITKYSFKNDRADFKSELRVWDVATGTAKQVLPVSTQTISSLVFALNGQQLLVGGVRRDDARSFATLELADLRTGSLGMLESREEGNISSVTLSPDGQTVAFQTDVSTVHLIDAQSWKIKLSFNETSDGSSSNAASSRFLLSVKSIMALAFAADGKTISGEIEQGGIKLWDTRTGEVKKQLAEHADTGSMAATSVDGTMLAEVGSDDETLRLWNVSTGEKKIFPVTDGPLAAIAISADGQRLAIAHPSNVMVLNTASGEVIQKLPPAKIDCLAFSDDGRALATAGEGGTIQTWDLASGQLTKTIPGTDKITALRFGRGGMTLASASGKGSVSLWELETGTLRLQLKKHSAAVNAIAFSADGNLLATGGDDRSVIIWETATGKARRTLKGHDLAVTSLAFSTDGSLLASGSGNASIVLWDVQTGKLNRVLR
jgi:WD40 repeat protein